ncbi:MAG: hypothetical protein KC933_12665 [Myxococcales bacterium]|nr:hypothetical protein [Myxococcales bacterium]MCB9650794.1 hypothetical protein [Deltaproteobacteria bacterium]
MSRPSPRFLSLVTRSALPELVAPTYAKLKNLDPNEAYQRLEQALRDLSLLDQIQQATWRAAEAEKAGMDEAALVEHIAKRLAKNKKFKAAPMKSVDEGEWVALSVALDAGAGVASGEARDLLDSPGGQALLRKGMARLGAHLAKELLR